MAIVEAGQQQVLDIDISDITREEIRRAIKKMNNNKAAGTDNFQAENNDKGEREHQCWRVTHTVQRDMKWGKYTGPNEGKWSS